jgi:hypothetical protein
MEWRKWRQWKWKKDKEKGRWTKKAGFGKETQRRTQERRYKGEDTSKKDNEDGKCEDIILERSVFKKKNEKEFWKYVSKFEIVGLAKSWVEERSWEKIEKMLPKEYEWECQGTKRRKKKGRAAERKFLELIGLVMYTVSFF